MNNQGTMEWRMERVGRITGSRVASILGCSKFASRGSLMKVMVAEALGNISNLSNPAMQWGTDMEDKAAKLYAALYDSDGEVTETGFHTKGEILGASPDRLVGDDGLVEIKCPYGIREDFSPRFSSIEDRPDYWHQMQAQMYCTDREWCDFFQWTPHGYDCVRVMRDPNWWDDNREAIEAFHAEYLEAVEAAREGGVAQVVATSTGWQEAAQRFAEASLVAEQAKAKLDEARKDLIAMVEGCDAKSIEAAGVAVNYVERKGSVDYKKMIDENRSNLPELNDDEYRKASSGSWRVTLKETSDA